MVNKQFAIGVLLGLSLAACAGATFPYKHYGIDLDAQALRGPTPSDDLSLSVCLATATDKSPCTAMMTEVFDEMELDYRDTKDKLITCQHQLAMKGN